MQINRWNSPARQLAQKKNRQEKCLFIAKNNWIVLAARWFRKHFFAPNSPLSQKSGGEKKEKRGNYEASFQVNAISIITFIISWCDYCTIHSYFYPWESILEEQGSYDWQFSKKHFLPLLVIGLNSELQSRLISAN